MPLTDALILIAICVAFVGFGVLVAWGEHQTRHLGRNDGARVGNSGPQGQRPIASVVRSAREREKATH